MTEFAVRSPDYVKLGLDPRWLFPDDGLQGAMLSEHLGAWLRVIFWRTSRILLEWPGYWRSRGRWVGS